MIRPKKGIIEEVIRELSRMNGEPVWMLEFRLASFRRFQKAPMPTWGHDLPAIVGIDIFPSDVVDGTGGESTIPDIGRTSVVGETSRYEAEGVFRRNSEALASQGVVFTDMNTALRHYPEVFETYFAKVIPPNDTMFTALNSSLWSGGSFIYVPPGVEIEMPLQAHGRNSAERIGRYERTLIIADEGSHVHAIEGCSAPVYTSDSLRCSVVEIIVKPSAEVIYTTIQNWSTNVFNLATKRAYVEAEGRMEWIDGNVGGRLSMTYPAVWLAGPKAAGEVHSMTYAGRGQHQDTGARMLHLAPETASTVVTKSISKDGGRTSSRSLVRVEDGAQGCTSNVRCEALILDDDSMSAIHPRMEVGSRDAQIGHETTVSKVADEQLLYLQSRGLSEEQAIAMVVNGFSEPVTRRLPMEYAVEWSRLIELKVAGSVG